MKRTPRQRALSPDDVAALLRATADGQPSPPAPPTAQQIRATPVALPRRRDRLPRPMVVALLLTDHLRIRVKAVVSTVAGLLALMGALVTSNAMTVATPPTATPSITSRGSSAATAVPRPVMADTPAPQLVAVSRDGSAMLWDLSRRTSSLSAHPSLPVTHVWLRDFWADVSDGDPSQAHSQEAFDVQVWWAPDRSARTRRVTLPKPAAGVFAEPYLNRPLPAGLPVLDHRDGPGSGTGNDEGIRVQIPNPSDDPGRLSTQLAATHPGTTGTRATLRAISDLYRQHHLQPRQRAAVLSVLASIGLRYMGDVVDRAGRDGVAFGVDLDNDGPGATRYLMVIDEDTGTLLSYEEDLLAPDAGSAPVAVATAHYVLYLASKTMKRIP